MRVVLHDISPWIMKRILDYVYSGELEITLDNAQDYLRTGHMLHYPAIVQTCCELLAEHLQVSNCLGVKEFAAMYHCDSLEQTAYNFATENFALVVEKGEELSELSYESLVEYLSSDSIDISNEMILWKAIHDWVNYDSEERKQHISELLKGICDLIHHSSFMLGCLPVLFIYGLCLYKVMSQGALRFAEYIRVSTKSV